MEQQNKEYNNNRNKQTAQYHIQHLEVHDVEDTILTINKVKKAYSPWNSKIYSLREVPNKK